jgi:(R,R)-butanediol dehydrogenase / meso-butanediol dehydrogenase / diacetyl reductase
MRAAQWAEPERLELAEVAEPTPADGQAVVEVALCGICGSDLSSFRGGLGTKPGQVLGHEFSGRVVAAPGVAHLDEGDRVTVRPLIPCGQCDRCRADDVHLCEAGRALDLGFGSAGAFAERVLVPRAVVGETVFKLPDSVSDRAGALVEPLAVALRAVRLTEIKSGDVAVVFGLGIIGLAAVHWLKTMGASTVMASDPSALRRRSAGQLGADCLIDPTSGSTVEAVAAVTGAGPYGTGARADVVLECSGAAPVFTDALRVARSGGTVVVAALYKSKLELHPNRLVEKELTLRGSFGYRDEFPRVIEELEGGGLDAERLISHTFPLAQIQEAFATQADASRSLKVAVVLNG